MRVMKWILALAVVQLCILASIATLVPGCANPEESNTVPGTNETPTLSSLSCTPNRIPVGSFCMIRGTFNDRDGEQVSWSLSLDPSSTAQGNFDPQMGSVFAPLTGANVVFSSSFTASSIGDATIVAVTDDGRGGTSRLTTMVHVGE